MRPAAAAIGVAIAAIASAASAAADPSKYMPTELISETPIPRPGSTVLIGFRMNPSPGWHGYWNNPGDAGLVPSVKWSAPAGVSFGPLLHPAPTLIVDSGMSSFVHEGPHLLLSRMRIPASVARGTRIPVKAQLSWAACTASLCVPLRATFTLNLVAGDGAPGPAFGSLQAALGEVPSAAPEGTYSSDGEMLRLLVPHGLNLRASEARFFPHERGTFVTARARASVADGKLALIAPAATVPADTIAGVLTDGRNAYRIAFDRVEPQPVATVPAVPPASKDRPVPLTPKPPQEAEAIPLQQPEADLTRPARFPWIEIAAAAALFGAVALAWASRRA